MINAIAAAKPAASPSIPTLDKGALVDQSLVRIGYAGARSEYSSSRGPFERTGNTVPLWTQETGRDFAEAGYTQSFVDRHIGPQTIATVDGTFDQAIAGAATRARSSKDSTQAQAVVDAGNGSWHIAALGSFHQNWVAGDKFLHSVVDGQVLDLPVEKAWGKVTDVTALHPAVSAVVGGRSWFDLRDSSRATTGQPLPNARERS